jgi:hypothetical protein
MGWVLVLYYSLKLNINVLVLLKLGWELHFSRCKI